MRGVLAGHVQQHDVFFLAGRVHAVSNGDVRQYLERDVADELHCMSSGQLQRGGGPLCGVPMRRVSAGHLIASWLQL